MIGNYFFWLGLCALAFAIIVASVAVSLIVRKRTKKLGQAGWDHRENR